MHRTSHLCLSFFLGETNDQNNRITSIFHPAYMDYITKNRLLHQQVDFKEETDGWIMPEKSFFDYLFNKS